MSAPVTRPPPADPPAELTPLSSAEIARRFTDHFARRGHTVVPSASLLADDPSLLLVVAGMVPFKPYLLGEQTPPYKRAVSVQKCVRTNDIDNVGRTSRHGSFFQMCGNFSFGDYFKAEAIELAWALLTTPSDSGGYGFPPERIWATVYLDDDEAFGLWQRHLPAERIQRRGKADNYWDMGVPGPCGPCSEIYYDRGPAHGIEGGPEADEERYLEVWNLVFMQYLRGPGAGYDYPIVGDLPARNIDTGLGLERVASLLQGVDNLYETDLLRPVLALAEQLTGAEYGADPAADVSLRVIAEHSRTAAMLIGDGVVPANEGRGYILRRMLRRAVRDVRLLGGTEPVMGQLVDLAVQLMTPLYPELRAQAARIRSVAVAEETSFLLTLRTGTSLLDTAVAQTRAAGGTTLSGDRAFALHDTYGFPIDLTVEMAAEQGLAVDNDAFRALMAEQRQRARQARGGGPAAADTSAYRTLLDAGGPTTFTGYAEVETDGTVRGLLVGGAARQSAGQGDEIELVLSRTAFYAEAGGQQADRGRVLLAGAELEVLDVQLPVPGLIVHRARVLSGEVVVGAGAHGSVDVERRKAISRAHTATHLVHRAFRGALGEQATQAGSLNAPGRLRFDFASPSAVPVSVLADVEAEVNAVLVEDLEVRAFLTSQEEARRIGAMALFGEKYGDEVRVVEVGDYARELCGGTHALRSGQLGSVVLLGEASIGAGVRRVEALVGIDAYRFSAREHVLLSQLAETFKVPADQVPDRVAAVLARLREADKELAGLRARAVLSVAGSLAADPTDVFGVAVVSHRAPDGTGADDLRRLVLDVRGRLDPVRPAVVAAGAVSGARPAVVAAVNETGRSWGLSAGELVRVASGVLGGGGGGKDDLAQGGGARPELLDAALAELCDFVGRRVTGSA